MSSQAAITDQGPSPTIELRALGALDLRGTEGVRLDVILTHPKRLALLAYLAVARPRGFQRRDVLLALLWPELDDEHARGALNQALHQLRNTLGPDVLLSRGTEEVGLAPSRLWCDVTAFDAAESDGRLEQALEVYRGELLQGFHVSASGEFERWLDTERARLKHAALHAAWVLGEQQEAAGNAVAAGHWARRAAELAADDEVALRRVLELLDRVGDRAGAIRVYDDFARRLHEIEVEPAPETEELMKAVRGRGGAARPPSEPVATPRAPGGFQRWLTWRKALVGGAVAFAALGLGTAGYMAMRLLRIGPLGTLVASGVLKQSEPLIVADFENRTPDSTLGSTLTEALRIDLSQSPTVKLADPEMVVQALRRMGRSPETRVTLALARELAQREGLKAIVTGDIASVGKGYVLSASLVAATNGQVLTAMRESAESEGVLIGAIDRLSRKLRERIGESLKSIRATEALEQVTTGSLSALRRYTEARQVEEAADFERAATLYQEATTLDTGFAMAYRKLAVVLGNAGGSQDRLVAAYTKAFALRERLPDVERYLAMAAYYTDVDYHPTEAVAAYRSVLERDPDNTIALNGLSQQLRAMRQFRQAESLTVRAMATTTTGAVYVNAIIAQVGHEHFADAETTLARFARVAPHDPRVLYNRALLASAQGAYPTAEQAARALRDEQRSSPTWDNRATFALAAVDAVQGKVSRAEREYEDVTALNEQRRTLRWYFLDALAIAQIDLRFRNRPAEALRRIAAALQHHPLATIPPLDRPYVPLSRYYARAGRLQEATRLLAEYERTIPEGIRRGDTERHGAEGDLLLARGRIADAIARYQAWYDEDARPRCFAEASCDSGGSLFEIATAYEQAHRPDSALTYYERFVTTPSLFRVYRDALLLARTYKRLGELYEQRGDRAKAVQYYSRFVGLWKDADPELQPTVRDVRAQLARLGGEH